MKNYIAILVGNSIIKQNWHDTEKLAEFKKVIEPIANELVEQAELNSLKDVSDFKFTDEYFTISIVALEEDAPISWIEKNSLYLLSGIAIVHDPCAYNEGRIYLWSVNW